MSSMPDLWSPDALVPRERAPSRNVPVVPRERVYGSLPMVATQESAARLAARREREKQEAVAAAWAEGFKTAELMYGMGVTYTSPRAEPNRMSLICAEVAEKHGFTTDELKSERRTRDVVKARQEAMWRCRRETPYSLHRIGKFFGGRDHATALNGIRKHEQRMAKEGRGE